MKISSYGLRTATSPNDYWMKVIKSVGSRFPIIMLGEYLLKDLRNSNDANYFLLP